MIITNAEFENILEVATNSGIDYNVFEGTLLDNAILYNNNKINVSGRTAKYLIIQEVYMSEWSSALKLSFINDDKRFTKILIRLEKLWG